MKMKEWVAVLVFVAIAIITSNLIGYDVSVFDSLTGVLILCGIALIAVLLSKVIPLKVPVILLCSLLGLLFASPISPIGDLVTESTSVIEFKAPLTIVGALAGISIGASFHLFRKQGWKMIVIALVVITSTYVGSLVISQLVLKLTNAI
ncbi:hypothetical protein CJ195_18090 [Bacillus sp. UMB0899]|uniref:hypothetical protein n=1 Tax=Metabacillus schmidteae TaxID=2730405 RepID=UPI000C80DF44|nr:hypothetical protein [Metabacillus schmidteae]PMC35698.1 hypothetical protein CJ195_18090 [Bacillus sp. UMB0899]